jgi:hypothetical protein
MVECYFYGAAWCLWGSVEKLFTLKSDFLERGGSIVKSDPGKKDILIKPLGVGIPLPIFLISLRFL